MNLIKSNGKRLSSRVTMAVIELSTFERFMKGILIVNEVQELILGHHYLHNMSGNKVPDYQIELKRASDYNTGLQDEQYELRKEIFDLKQQNKRLEEKAAD